MMFVQFVTRLMAELPSCSCILLSRFIAVNRLATVRPLSMSWLLNWSTTPIEDSH